MKRRIRTVLPLPSYTKRKWSSAASRWRYYFEPPVWARDDLSATDDRGKCPVEPEALGVDYDAAVQRVERVLLPAFHSWRTRGVLDVAPSANEAGTLDWLFAAYRGSGRPYNKLGRKTRALHERGFDLVGSYVLKDGRRLGSVKLSKISKKVVSSLYEKLLVTGGPRAGGRHLASKQEDLPLIAGDTPAERRTTVNHAMKSCRRAWNVAAALHAEDVPATNPFAGMGLVSSEGETPTADYEDLLAAVAAADALGLRSIAAALMVTWEWLQREEHIFTAFRLDHYRPRNRPDEVKIVHPKNGDYVWYPLFDDDGETPLFPELMARMDALKRDRIGSGLFFVRDWSDLRAKMPLPWATASGDLRHLSRKVREVLARAGIDAGLTFTSFRHGGMTELGDADLTDAQIRALSRHRSAAPLPRYVKKTRRQITDGVRKRRAIRPAAEPADDPQLSLFEVRK